MIVAWERDQPRPLNIAVSNSPAPVCLWSSGYLANHGELQGALGSSPEITDSELLSALWERHGESLPEHLNGACAFVLWDARARVLFAARDRLGTRGLYWCERGPRVALASEPGALAAEAGAELNPRALAAQIAWAAPPAGETWFRNVRALAPGEALRITPAGIERRRYWAIEARPRLRLRDDAAYAEAFWEVFLAAVRGVLDGRRAGVTLSSGLDSAAVAAAVADAGSPALVLSWCSPELPEAEEGPWARRAAERLGIEVAEVRADRLWPLSSTRWLDVPALGPPLTFYGEIWDETFAVARRAGVERLLTGYSGDHLFGGDVFPYADLLLEGRWIRFASELRAHARCSELSWHRLVRHLILSPLVRRLGPGRRQAPVWPPWLTPRGRELAGETAEPPPTRGLPPGRAERLRALRDPLLPRMAEDITARAARAGLELEHPWLDHRLVELAAAMPSDQGFEGGERKRVVRRALRGRIPDEFLDRRGKIYPYAIARRGLAEREVARVLSLMTDMRLAAMGLVDEGVLRSRYDDYRRDEGASSLFWHTLMLEAWVRRHRMGSGQEEAS